MTEPDDDSVLVFDTYHGDGDGAGTVESGPFFDKRARELIDLLLPIFLNEGNA